MLDPEPAARPATVDIPASLQLAANLVRGWIRTGHYALGIAVAVSSLAVWAQTSAYHCAALPVTPVAVCLLFVLFHVQSTRQEVSAALQRDP